LLHVHLQQKRIAQEGMHSQLAYCTDYEQLYVAHVAGHDASTCLGINLLWYG
jgi:hypothetical protein